MTPLAYVANMPSMFSIATGLVDQQIRITALERELAAYKAAVTEGQQIQAEAILRSMNEEATNLGPRFTMAERDVLVLGVGLATANEQIDRTFATMLTQTLIDMHVTDAVMRTANGR